MIGSYHKFIPTKHALKRWAERFPGLDMDREYQVARGIGNGKAFKQMCNQLNPYHRNKFLKNGGTCYMLLAKKSGAVFVMDKGAIVITVLKLPTDTKED